MMLWRGFQQNQEQRNRGDEPDRNIIRRLWNGTIKQKGETVVSPFCLSVVFGASLRLVLAMFQIVPAVCVPAGK